MESMKKTRTVKKVRRLNWQKVFCTLSASFLLACVLFYGGRFIYLYTENNKITTNDNLLAITIKNSNSDSDNFKSINGSYYFYGDVSNNYVEYSNLLWRIVKITSSNEIVLVSDEIVTSLASGAELSYLDSYIYKWLNDTNEDYTGIFQKSLNNHEKYLVKNNVCLDTLDKATSHSCSEVDSNSYISSLSMDDYINTGKAESFINNGYYFYLADKNSDNESWYVGETGVTNNASGEEILGIKAVITLNSNIEIVSGEGTSTSPYVFEKEKSLTGSYVKLGDEEYRILEVNGDNYKLVLNDYLTVEGDKLKYKYSNNTYFHNDAKSGSIAYYLNNVWLRSLDYADVVLESEFANGYYEGNNFDYTKVLEETIETKVGLLSVGDIIFNSSLSDYYLATGLEEDSTEVYVFEENGKMETNDVSLKGYVVPVITVSKDIFTIGEGTASNPYSME